MADPYDDFDRWDMEQAKAESRRPKCCKCENAIWDDKIYRYNNHIFCKECFDKKFQRWTEDEIRNCECCSEEFDELCYFIDGNWLCADCVDDSFSEDIDE